MIEQHARPAMAATIPGFVMTATASKIIPICHYARMAPDIAVIVGGAGVGKTTALEHYRASHAATGGATGGGTGTGGAEVWLATMEPTTAAPTTMLRAVARSLGVELRGLGDAAAEVRARLRGSQGLLIVDEAQHLTVTALDQLRSLHDMVGIGIVLSGNESLYARIDGGSRKPEWGQLFSRVGMRATIARPAEADITGLLDAWGVVDAGERRWLTVIARKPGALRGLCKVLTLAGLLADGGDEGRTIKHMQAAWAQLAGSGMRDAAADDARAAA